MELKNRERKTYEPKEEYITNEKKKTGIVNKTKHYMATRSAVVLVKPVIKSNIFPRRSL